MGKNSKYNRERRTARTRALKAALLSGEKAGEAVVFYKSKNFLIEVSGEEKDLLNQKRTRHFKLYNAEYAEDATKLCRISITDASYIQYPNNEGKEHWILNADEKDRLVSFLNSPDRIGIRPIYSNYQLLVDYINWVDGINRERGGTFKNFVNVRRYKSFLPIDLPMPDYTQLPEE